MTNASKKNQIKLNCYNNNKLVVTDVKSLSSKLTGDLFDYQFKL